MDAAVPVDANSRAHRDLQNRADRGFTQRPQPSSTRENKNLEQLETRPVPRPLFKFARSQVNANSEVVGPLTFGRKEEQIFLGRDFAQQTDYSEETASTIDQEIKWIVTENYDRARSILKEKKRALRRIAEELLAREVLSGEQVTRIISGQPLAAPVEAAPVTSDQPTSVETERPPIVPPLRKPLPQE